MTSRSSARYPGVEGIFVGDGTAIHTILDSSTGFSFQSVSIDDSGAVLFRALRDGKFGVHLVRGGIVEKVLEAGDPFGAFTAITVGITNQALNNLGQMTLSLDTTGGDQIVRVDPVFAPAVPALGGPATLLLMGILGASGALVVGRLRPSEDRPSSDGLNENGGNRTSLARGRSDNPPLG